MEEREEASEIAQSLLINEAMFRTNWQRRIFFNF